VRDREHGDEVTPGLLNIQIPPLPYNRSILRRTMVSPIPSPSFGPPGSTGFLMRIRSDLRHSRCAGGDAPIGNLGDAWFTAFSTRAATAAEAPAPRASPPDLGLYDETVSEPDLFNLQKVAYQCNLLLEPYHFEAAKFMLIRRKSASMSVIVRAAAASVLVSALIEFRLLNRKWDQSALAALSIRRLAQGPAVRAHCVGRRADSNDSIR